MIQEVTDLFILYSSVHNSMDKMLADLPADLWTRQPAAGMNTIASIVEHVLLVEQKFMAVLVGDTTAIETQAPFSVTHWDVKRIQADWAATVPKMEQVLEALTADQMSVPVIKLGIGELNRRQVVAYAIAHMAHHRGQIPLLKRLLNQ